MGSCQSNPSVIGPEVPGTGGATSKTSITTIELEENAEEECPICLEPNTAPYFLNCGHWLCPEHVPKIHKCPLCRHDVTSECDPHWMEGIASLSGDWSSSSGSSMLTFDARIAEMEFELDSGRVSTSGSDSGSSRSSGIYDWSYERPVVDLDSLDNRTLYEREVVDFESEESLRLNGLEAIPSIVEYDGQGLDTETISLDSMHNRSPNESEESPVIAPWHRGILQGQSLDTQVEHTVLVDRQTTTLDQQDEITLLATESSSEDDSFSADSADRSSTRASF